MSPDTYTVAKDILGVLIPLAGAIGFALALKSKIDSIEKWMEKLSARLDEISSSSRESEKTSQSVSHNIELSVARIEGRLTELEDDVEKINQRLGQL